MNPDLVVVQRELAQVQSSAELTQTSARSVKVQLEHCKSQMMSLMQRDNIPFVPLGPQLYAIRKKKTTKPPLSSDMLSVALRLHARSHSVAATEEFFSTFCQCIEDCQRKMSTTQEVLELSKSIPVQSLYAG